ncbi:MAG TPA: DUF1003 domain-containing protein [Candidatus Faecisoma merdavium]|nr:DUF1003 domain-containing protein [Candidatus Faecisoma merdavium]
MDKNKKNEIVKMLLKRKEDVNEEELIELLFDQPIAVDVDKLEKNNMKFKDKLADKITSIVGSWLFIILFGLLLVIWILVNILFVKSDNSSLILNLFLSCVAAFQAPIIMMSQNRQAKKDSLRNQNDYRTDLKSELILEQLHDQIESIASNQRKILKKLEEKNIDVN